NPQEEWDGDPDNLKYPSLAGETIAVRPEDLELQLNAGVDVTVQTSNDILLAGDITVSNGAGDGGALIFQAGRSILLQADIVTDNGNLWLIANDDLANGVVDVDRNTGAAEIFMSDEASIDAGTGTVTIE